MLIAQVLYKLGVIVISRTNIDGLGFPKRDITLIITLKENDIGIEWLATFRFKNNKAKCTNV